MRLDRNQAQAAVVLGCRLAEVNADAGYQPIEAVADAALAARRFRRRGGGAARIHHARAARTSSR